MNRRRVGRKMDVKETEKHCRGGRRNVHRSDSCRTRALRGGRRCHEAISEDHHQRCGCRREAYQELNHDVRTMWRAEEEKRNTELLHNCHEAKAAVDQQRTGTPPSRRENRMRSEVEVDVR